MTLRGRVWQAEASCVMDHRGQQSWWRGAKGEAKACPARTDQALTKAGDPAGGQRGVSEEGPRTEGSGGREEGTGP